MAHELNTLEDDQRKFVSNISHDFRSPLTSIRGYVVAMLDGTIPVEMRDKYLNVILTETERLTKLTSGLIELNQYGGHGKTILDKTDFDINEVIGQTAATFEGVCNEKHIVLELVLTGERLCVHADQSKVQQIIYNLTDNAIKFSSRDSSIRIETSVKNGKVFVAVKDHGIGIPKEAIGKIWERFYKTDLSRGKDKKGTGIGLSIVKEIIQAHGENINVISTEGVGTEFIFTLPFVDEDGKKR
jgi:signal transduction histidine kinase